MPVNDPNGTQQLKKVCWLEACAAAFSVKVASFPLVYSEEDVKVG